VRIGNGAHRQLQLDTYGEVLDASWLYHQITGAITDREWALMRGLVEFVCDNWRRPENGIWEVRGALRHFTDSKVMCWVALDRGIRLAYALGDGECQLERWEATREAIRAQVLARGYDRERRSFVQSYDAKALDASTLRLSHVGFLPGDDPRMLATIDRVREELELDGLVYRYRVEETDDGLHGEEGAFLICSFWLVSSLALAGRCEEAQTLLSGPARPRQRPRAVLRGARPGRDDARQLPPGVHTPRANPGGSQRRGRATRRRAAAQLGNPRVLAITPGSSRGRRPMRGRYRVAASEQERPGV
jgi:GH15 family glucan-1,4-alpha-glucosidase